MTKINFFDKINDYIYPFDIYTGKADDGQLCSALVKQHKIHSSDIWQLFSSHSLLQDLYACNSYALRNYNSSY